MMVDLPEPVAPTRATLFPAGTVNERLYKIYLFSLSGKSLS